MYTDYALNNSLWLVALAMIISEKNWNQVFPIKVTWSIQAQHAIWTKVWFPTWVSIHFVISFSPLGGADGKGSLRVGNFFHSTCFSYTVPLTATASMSVSPWENPIHILTIWLYFIMLFVLLFPNLGDSRDRDNFSPCPIKVHSMSFLLP